MHATRSPSSPTERRPRRRRPLTAVALLLLLLAALAVPSVAVADWDVNTFVKLRDDAQALYNAEAYEDALPRYRVLESMIEEALVAGDIPDNQEQSAREALEVVRYQIARSHQGLAQCNEARRAYAALEESAVTDDVRAKVAVRLPETHVCVALDQLADGDEDAAITSLTTASSMLDARTPPSGLSPESTAMVEDVARVVRVDLEAAHTQVVEVRLDRVRHTITNGQCEDGRRRVAEAEAIVVDDTQRADLIGLASKVDDVCTRDQIAERERLAAEEAERARLAAAADSDLPIGPIVLLSTGAAVLIGDAVFEATVADDDVDAWEAARDTCRDTGLGCDRAMQLRDDVETDRTISIVLLSVGGAAVLAGATWWIIDAATDDEAYAAPTGLSTMIVPTSEGAMASFTLTLP